MNNNQSFLKEDALNELIEISNVSNKIRKNLEKKYKISLDPKNGFEIIKLIKEDLIHKYYNISLLEVEFLSNNIYYYSYLIANNVSKNDIIDFTSSENVNYYNKITNNGRLEKFNSEINLRYIKYLINKYIELIKNN